MKIKYVNQPKKPDGKFGNIKMETGETFFVNVGRLNLYHPGMEIDPPSTAEKWGDNVVNVIPANYDPSGGSAPNTAPPSLNPSYNQQPAPPVTNSYGNNKDVLIVAQVLYKGILSSGNWGVTDLPGMRAAIVAEARAIVDACK